MNKTHQKNIKAAKSKASSRNPVYKLPRVMKHRIVKSQKQLISSLAKTNKDIMDGEYLGWAKDIYDVPLVWDETKGKNIPVAVLDTGIDADHPDLIDAIVTNGVQDFTGEGGADEDFDGHGTHCAGIIGARNNGIGVMGVAPKCQLMAGKVLGKKGGKADGIAKGIYWAVESGADILSMSFGGTEMSPQIYTAIQYALMKGKIVICAAGNSGIGNGNTIDYPARYGGVITVAAHDINGNPSGFSSRGGELDFMAPGTKIWSTDKNGKYARDSGTSMAAPFVAGLAALIMSKHQQPGGHKTPIENCEDMKNHLLRMATHPNQHDTQSGYGALLPFKYFNEAY